MLVTTIGHRQRGRGIWGGGVVLCIVLQICLVQLHSTLCRFLDREKVIPSVVFVPSGLRSYWLTRRFIRYKTVQMFLLNKSVLTSKFSCFLTAISPLTNTSNHDQGVLDQDVHELMIPSERLGVIMKSKQPPPPTPFPRVSTREKNGGGMQWQAGERLSDSCDKLQE